MRSDLLAVQFDDQAQQREADTLGMWLFLVSEIMLFGGLFMGVLVTRMLHPDAVSAASGRLDLWLGGVNTAVLLTSSVTMALADHGARRGRRRETAALLGATALFGAVFLAIKGIEYAREYREGLMPGVGPVFPPADAGSELFFNLYFVATGLHAFHLLVGIVVVLTLAARLVASRGALPAAMAIENSALYWHLVDIVWVFLYPVLYLIR